jgi:hypothetical protein
VAVRVETLHRARGWDARCRKWSPQLLFIFLVEGSSRWSSVLRVAGVRCHRRPYKRGEGREAWWPRRVARVARCSEGAGMPPAVGG